MRFRFVDAQRARYPIRLLCRVLEVSRSGFYAWRKREPSPRSREDARLTVEICAAHRASLGTYGSPRIQRELEARGHRVGVNRVARLMRDAGVRGVPQRRRARGTDSSGGSGPAPDRIRRDFRAERPNERWVADTSYVWTREGWLYLAVVIDLFSRMVVGWDARPTRKAELAGTALARAIRARTPRPGGIHHSDRGGEYASDRVRGLLASHGLLASMGSPGSSADNAVVESFFGTLKTEMVYRSDFDSLEEAKAALFGYIDGFYNTRRRHSYLGNVSPVEFEKSATLLEQAA